MIWKKRIPGYVVTVLFAIVGLAGTVFHFRAAFGNIIVALIATVVAAGLTVLLAFGLRKLSGSIKKSLAEELTDKVKWQKILWIAGAAVAVCGLIFRIVLAVTATDVSENALFHAALTGEYTDDSTGGVRVRLYIAILGTLLKLAGGSVKGALVMQSLLYVIAAVLVFCGVMFLGGRGGAVLGEAVMLFLPLFPSAHIVKDDVMFWLMLGAGIFVGALYVRYATDSDPEETFLMKILISIFTGLLVGIIFGWDAGLIVLFVIAAYAFFAEGVRPLSVLPLFAAFLISSVGGFFVSVASPSAWTKYYFSDIRSVLPLARDQYTIWIAIIGALSLTAVSAFFVRKKRETVTIWMLFSVFAYMIAGQMPLSGVFAPAFLFLVLSVLFGASVSSLLVRAAMDAPEGVVPAAKEAGRQAAKKEPEPVFAKREGADTEDGDAEVDKLLEHVWVEQIVKEAMGEDTSEEKAAIQAALREAEEAESAPAAQPVPAAQPASEPEMPATPAVPSGMVLPQGDGAVDADTTPRIPETFPGTPDGAPIALQRETEDVAPAAPAAPAATAAEAIGLGGVAELARRMEEDRKRAEAEAEKLAQRLSAEQSGGSLEEEIRRREMEETARREALLRQQDKSGMTDAEADARRRAEEEEAARRRAEEEEAARRRAEEEEAARRRAEEEEAARRRAEEEEATRRRAEEEEAARRRAEEEEAARRRAEEEEAARRRAEEEEAARRRAEEEEAARRRAEEEEAARRRAEEEEAARRRAEEEEAARRRAEETARIEDAAERRRREDEEIAERRRREDEELAARRREEDERRQREEDERRQREEDERRQREEDERRQREEDERRQREEDARRQREEDERRQREEDARRRREERSPAARSVGRKPASEGFDFDIADGDDFDL